MENTFSLSDARNEAGEWTMSPEQIRAEMAYESDPYDAYEDYEDYDEPDEDEGCEGHESLAGPIGNVVFCDGSCVR